MKIGRYNIEMHKLPYYKKIIGRKFVNNVKTVPVFVIGNQRSGTTMLLSKLNRHFWVDVFHERSNAMNEWELKPFPEIEAIIRQSKAKVCIFKPLEESHRANELLENFDGCKAIFIFRHYADVINSSLKLGWGAHLRQYIENIRNDSEFKYSGPLNLTAKNVQLVKDLYHHDMSEESCVALIWYLRNTLYFDCKLRENPAVLLLQYEKIIANPQKEMTRILNFLNLPPSRSVLHDISRRSAGKRPPKRIDGQIQNACDSMFESLVAALPE